MVELKPMTDTEYTTIRPVIIDELADALVLSERAKPENSIQAATAEQDKVIHSGVNTPGHYFYLILNEETEQVGMVWFGIMPDFDEEMVFIFFIYIDSHFRRRGYASEALIQLETKVLENGRKRIRLHTLKSNATALRTYKSCGYTEFEEHEHGIIFEKILN